MCLTLYLGRKVQTSEPLEPAVTGLAGLLESPHRPRLCPKKKV